jgi:ferredoxin
MPLVPDQRLGRGHYKDAPVRMGTAFVDRGRCFPWAMQTPCLVCEEVCPVSPKAIWTEEVQSIDRDGNPVLLARPRVDPALCIGCAKCMHHCPVKDMPAIRVTAIGETRSRERSLVLPGSQGRKLDGR